MGADGSPREVKGTLGGYRIARIVAENANLAGRRVVGIIQRALGAIEKAQRIVGSLARQGKVPERVHCCFVGFVG